MAAAARVRLVAASTTTRGVTIWSADPTRPTWDPVVQATVAATLRRGRAADRRLAVGSVRAAGTRARQRSIHALPIDVALLTAYRFELAGMSTSNAAARRVAGAISVRTYARVRGASKRGWSQSTPGAWSTLGEHRQLVARSRALLRVRPHAATSRVVERFAGQLAVPPAVTFGGLPAAAFYPWPRDGAFDSEQVQVVVDKPAVVGLTVYGADDTPVRTTEQSVAPGSVQLAWDGAANDGTIVPAGEYRYAVTATDLVGNQQLVAGLGTFTVARDTTPPVAKRGTVSWGVTKAGPRITASWDVEEVHSPRVKTYLALASGTTRTSMLLHETLQKATVRRPTTLAAGTWRVSYVFIDGSGNRTNLPAGTFVVR
ncbi:MAG: FlgD Ig-like domain [Thermoleophilia bacterium]|nr:FlgD Ig-like domain [Thermoleophilia bacterium]MCZ4496934.1 FlgD Ig-like domain [Thermoleophilia bacterium]